MASQTKRQSQYVVTLLPGSLLCLVAAQDLIIKWNESRGHPVDVTRDHELICYLRTLIELGERMEWRGNAYNSPMVVGKQPDMQSLPTSFNTGQRDVTSTAEPRNANLSVLRSEG